MGVLKFFKMIRTRCQTNFTSSVCNLGHGKMGAVDR